PLLHPVPLYPLSPPSFLLFFSFYSYLAPRDLHSFPTRRSSDLQVFSAPAIRIRKAFSPMPIWKRSLIPPTSGLLRAPESSSEERDRKSTRLNSSHGSISYAVFCLKKKKKKKKQSTKDADNKNKE